MCQEAFQVTWVKVPPIQSLASTIVPSLAMKQVTASRSVDREDAGCNLWVNGLSPENVSSWGADSARLGTLLVTYCRTIFNGSIAPLQLITRHICYGPEKVRVSNGEFVHI